MKYKVGIDVTMTGTVYVEVEAGSEDEADRIGTNRVRENISRHLNDLNEPECECVDVIPVKQ